LEFNIIEILRTLQIRTDFVASSKFIFMNNQIFDYELSVKQMPHVLYMYNSLLICGCSRSLQRKSVCVWLCDEL